MKIFKEIFDREDVLYIEKSIGTRLVEEGEYYYIPVEGEGKLISLLEGRGERSEKTIYVIRSVSLLMRIAKKVKTTSEYISFISACNSLAVLDPKLSQKVLMMANPKV